MDHYSLCDKILKECQELEDITISLLTTLYFTEDSKSLSNALYTLKKDGYVRNTSGPVHHRITGEGIAFARSGGYAAQMKKDAASKSLTERKLDLDVKNAQRIYNTYWYTFVAAIAAFVISLLLLILKLKGL